MGERRRRAVLFGGSGFLGRLLRQRLIDDGFDVTIIGRGPNETHDRWKMVNWDAENLGDRVSALDGADVIVHLASKRVDCRPTKANIAELIASREQTVRLVGEVLDTIETTPHMGAALITRQFRRRRRHGDR